MAKHFSCVQAVLEQVISNVVYETWGKDRKLSCGSFWSCSLLGLKGPVRGRIFSNLFSQILYNCLSYTLPCFQYLATYKDLTKSHAVMPFISYITLSPCFLYHTLPTSGHTCSIGKGHNEVNIWMPIS